LVPKIKKKKRRNLWAGCIFMPKVCSLSTGKTGVNVLGRMEPEADIQSLNIMIKPGMAPSIMLPVLVGYVSPCEDCVLDYAASSPWQRP
jgi:hypothetical protein